ncbi:MAG: helix-turn-helix domain-containing protein, partial [Candidatus Eremiobacterota bacterium]
PVGLVEQKPSPDHTPSLEVPARETPVEQKTNKVALTWSPGCVTRGFTPVANAFLDHYHKLGLKPSQVLLIIHLIRSKGHRKYASSSVPRLARCLQVNERTIRALVKDLCEKGVLHKIERRTAPNYSRTNLWDLSPLFARLEELERHRPAKRNKEDQ